ncbi:hypothetical protein [Sulfurimonas sp. HSL3-2]|uniref:hypothetical protein n=1 Tax=Hydrocurvibacter mobilis TaxID=3131936 RepID=UPI0031F75DB3
MLNVPELEKKWLTYKIKSFLPHIVLSILVIVIVPFIIVFYPSDKTEKIVKTEKNDITTTKNKIEADIALNSVEEINKEDLNTSNALKEDDKLVLKPSLNFVNKIEDSMVTYYDDDKHTKKSETKTASKTIVKKTVHKEVKKQPVHVAQEDKEDKNDQITIKTESVDKNMQDVIQRFKKTNNPVLSLFLAKKYYEMKKYDLSYNYALITNQIDNKIDMSWIIFTKSLVKLGQKDMAVNTLKSYIKNSNSQTAITLLDEIESGRFQ